MTRWSLGFGVGLAVLALDQVALADGDGKQPVVQGQGGVNASGGVGVDAGGAVNGAAQGVNGAVGGATGAVGGAAGGVNANGEVGANGGGGITGLPPATAPVDGVRFRGGIQLDAGPLITPASDILPVIGFAGLQGQTGVQINNLVGIYVVPGLDIFFGKATGVGVSAALMVDFTIGDIFTVGAGPDAGIWGAISVSTENQAAAGIGGANYGARLRFAVNPLVGHSDIRRNAMTIGLDIRMLGGPVAAVATNTGGTTGEGTPTGFVFSPVFTFGYTAF